MPWPMGIPFYSNLLESCASRRNLSKLKELHARVIAVGIYDNDFVRTKLIAAYANCLQLKEAISIFSVVNKQSTYLYNTLIRSHANLNLYNTSISIYIHMLQWGIPPDSKTLPTVLRSCAAMSSLLLGRQFHKMALNKGFCSDMATCNALVSMYGKCGDLDSANQLFDEMHHRNYITWSSIIAAYASHGEHQEALRLFEEMLKADIKPDEITFTALLVACSHGGLIDTGWKYFQMMEKKFAIRPVLQHYTCMVDMLGRAGKVEEAETLIGEMVMEPDDAIWAALLSACKKYGKLDIAERVAEKFYGNVKKIDSSHQRLDGRIPST